MSELLEKKGIKNMNQFNNGVNGEDFELLGKIIEASYNEIYLFDPSSLHFVYANASALENLGYTKKEILALSPLDIKPNYNETNFRAKIAYLLENRDDHIVIETTHRRKDGTTYMVEARVELMQIKERLLAVAIAVDITERFEIEQKLREQHTFVQAVVDAIHDSVMVIDLEFNVVLMNRQARESGDFEFVSDKSRPKCYELSHHRKDPCAGDEHPCPVKEVIATQQSVSVVHNHKTKDGKDRFIELRTIPMLDASGQITACIESGHDITELINTQRELSEYTQQLTRLAYYDQLTGLPNRTLFYDRLEQSIKKADRKHEKIALLYLDLDKFKEINDTKGHQTGDEVLKEVAKRLSKIIRSSDTVARLAGDEFTVILEHVSEQISSGRVAKKLLQELSKPFIVHSDFLDLQCSIGISLYPDDAGSVEKLLQHADTALYAVKKSGGGNYYHYSDVSGSEV
jgi:diguanylate cyclase (GGDEF)-like protein/PAS domain S-box-containing protein